MNAEKRKRPFPGRPPLDPGCKRVNVMMTVSTEFRAWLRAESIARGLPIGRLVELLVKREGTMN